jgi:hypothetical protein
LKESAIDLDNNDFSLEMAKKATKILNDALLKQCEGTYLPITLIFRKHQYGISISRIYVPENHV